MAVGAALFFSDLPVKRSTCLSREFFPTPLLPGITQNFPEGEKTVIS